MEINYGQIIKRERTKRKFSLAILSKMSGVPITTIGNWERGYEPTVKNLDRVLEALGISITLGKK